MQLLIIRHAIAEEREDFAKKGEGDDDRPLTSFGKRRMQRNTQGLRRIASHIEVLAASPLVRAQQTARIVAEEYRIRDIQTVDELRPDRRSRELITWLSKQDADATIAVVGHEPHLGTLITWCVSGVERPGLTLKKGGVALIEFEGKPGPGKGALGWLLTPAQLRALGE
ncbi:MAG: phosphohistidine phosphatase SixA [Gemmatimonadaceae bacterium]|nr:phosphohistidine phosphatase SixA [Gemmatimonadaceae bacterium]